MRTLMLFLLEGQLITVLEIGLTIFREMGEFSL